MKSLVSKILFFTLFNLLIVEGVLRVQQAAGPLYDLVMAEVTLDRLSDELNHVPLAEETLTFDRAEAYGDRVGETYTIRRDEHGVRINSLRPAEAAGVPRVLFLGDSFVEGYADANTLVQRTWEALRRTAPDVPSPVMLNAGHSSYSPAILIPQARRLVPALRPDYVVVVIDQTDLGDDYMRYERLVRRGPDGRIVGVSHTPVGRAFEQGLIDARGSKLYLARFVRKLHHTRVRMPALRRDWRSWYPHSSLANAEDPDGDARKYAVEIAVFERNLDELITTIVELTGDPGRVLMVVHPHRRQLVADPGETLWNDFVTPAVAAAAVRGGAAFLAAGQGLVEASDGDPTGLYWPGDMHFNYMGIAAYGGVIAATLGPMLAR